MHRLCWLQRFFHRSCRRHNAFSPNGDYIAFNIMFICLIHRIFFLFTDPHVASLPSTSSGQALRMTEESKRKIIVFFPRILLFLAGKLLKGTDDTETCIARFDDVVYISIGSSVVRIAE